MEPSNDRPRALVIASGNAGKVCEFSRLLAGLGLEIRPQPAGLEVEETGSSFAENAAIKASAVARLTGCWALADDSGLCVAALDGAPGVHSARYAATDAARISRLLEELAAVRVDPSDPGAGPHGRGAHFSAALALADPSGTVRLAVEGHCPGVILEAPRGSGGFGYDPVFHVPEAGQTFAEMDSATKARLGHRGRAFAALEPKLRQLFASP